MVKWILKKESADIELMSKTLKISEKTAQIMVNRNIRTKNNAIKFLQPTLKYLRDPLEMKDMESAIGLLSLSISLNEKIVIYGDYDVDGVTSTTILYKTLKKHGANVSYYIPNRQEEGYGLNSSAVLALKEYETDLIITVDNGIASLNEILEAQVLGMKVIVIDHHEPSFIENEKAEKSDVLPLAYAIVDPKQKSCPYPFKSLCAGGLAYKFAKAFYEAKETEFAEEDEFLVLAMISTFCDIVDLQDENRIIAKNGLDILNKNKMINKGLYALLYAKGYTENLIDSFVIGFIIGPCINAAGRLDNATKAVELLISDDETEAEELAKKLCQLNEERKALTTKSVEDIVFQIEENEYYKNSVIVVYNEDVHESIAGIVAGRVKELYYKPSIIITNAENGAKGSARSIEGYNIFEELSKCKELFSRFGGHPMAAGLSLEIENIDILRNQLNENCQLQEEDFIEKIYIDDILELSQVTYDLATEIKVLSPFGKGNYPPLFLTKNLKLEQIRVIEEKNTILFTFPIEGTYRRIKGVCFGKVELLKKQLSRLYEPYECEKIMAGVLRNTDFQLDIVYYMEINEYNGNVSVQMSIKDFILYTNNI